MKKRRRVVDLPAGADHHEDCDRVDPMTHAHPAGVDGHVGVDGHIGAVGYYINRHRKPRRYYGAAEPADARARPQLAYFFISSLDILSLDILSLFIVPFDILSLDMVSFFMSSANAAGTKGAVVRLTASSAESKMLV